MIADQTPRLTSLSPGAGCACKLPLAKLEALFATMGSIPKAEGDLLIGAAEGDDAALLRRAGVFRVGTRTYIPFLPMIMKEG